MGAPKECGSKFRIELRIWWFLAIHSRRLLFYGDGLHKDLYLEVCLNEDLRTTTLTMDKVKGRLLLDVVVNFFWMFLSASGRPS